MHHPNVASHGKLCHFDVAAVVQMLHPKNSRSFSEYGSDIFIPYIMSQFRNATC